MASFTIDAPLKVIVLVFVALLKALKVVQLVHKVAHLLLERGDLAITFSKLLFFALKIKCLLVDHAIKLFDLVESF